jgi:hypothetical protein
MSNESVRRNSPHPPKHEPGYFDPEFLDEEEAGRAYHRCMKALVKSDAHAQTAGEIRVGAYYAQIHAIYNGHGRLVRFWLRTVIGNHLLIIGNRDGLLPLNVESLHGR